MNKLHEILHEINVEWKSGELGVARDILSEKITLEKDLVLAIQDVRILQDKETLSYAELLEMTKKYPDQLESGPAI